MSEDEPSATRLGWGDRILLFLVPLIAVAASLVGVWVTNGAASAKNLRTARELAWSEYLGTLDELDRIQPALIEGALPGDEASGRWRDAYPDSKRQAAVVRVLTDEVTSEKIEKLQDDKLSELDYWVQEKAWRNGAEPETDFSREVDNFFDVAREESSE